MNDQIKVGAYGEWGAGGPLNGGQAPGYPVFDHGRAVAWFIYRIDAEAFAALRGRLVAAAASSVAMPESGARPVAHRD